MNALLAAREGPLEEDMGNSPFVVVRLPVENLNGFQAQKHADILHIKETVREACKHRKKDFDRPELEMA